jgi:NADPH:quinone reductase
MRAVWLREFGGPGVLTVEETPDPVPGPAQVLVDVEFAGVTFVETQVRAGRGPFAVELPMIMGNGVGGRVGAAGAGVDPELVGRRVVGGTGGSGGYAERVAVAAAGLHPLPDGLAMDAAAAVLADGRTALMLVAAAALGAGERVLVEAAAGGVGTLLVQAALAAGATVVAAAGGAGKTGVARALGAQVAVDYSRPGWPARVRAAVGAVDVVFDGVGGALARSAFDLLAPGGRMVSFGLASGAWAEIRQSEAAARGVRLVRPRPAPDQLREYTGRALAETAAGRLRPLIGRRYPLERAAEAHAAIAARATTGKTLLAGRGPGSGR